MVSYTKTSGQIFFPVRDYHNVCNKASNPTTPLENFPEILLLLFELLPFYIDVSKRKGQSDLRKYHDDGLLYTFQSASMTKEIHWKGIQMHVTFVNKANNSPKTF